MPDDVWAKIVQDVADMGFRGQIGLYLHGEPLLHRGLVAKIGEIRAVTNAFVVLSTNGALLTPVYRRELIAVLPRTVHINVPSPDAVQYEQMTGLSFTRMVDNVRAFVQEANGAVEVRINCPQTPEVELIGMYADVFPGILIETEYWACSRAGLVDEVSASGHRTRFNTNGHPYCTQPTQNFCVLHDGSVLACCNDWAGLSRAAFPNVLESSIAEIYAGPAMEYVRRDFIRGDYTRFPMCATCAAEMGWYQCES